ncbi:sigma-54-dependent transcriptional regulator [Shewanella phaeophyticola]|uniref:Sigma 54-interacting transcriptional regulator n=1 Tax=Shewanella phaeophyticola TaxID=2978345 RepID=A0ABT2NZD9_9GAMM|nr:sigma 54-interacting transcriptional regulator [Shewanella sp. KJ10-1]MCT8985768.1 sigma 54-interacting transcriptional regulator [Shewanella sp. KJ10-1]
MKVASTILLEGETGTGKRLFAKSLHQLLCPNEPILELSLLGITVSELEEKLFGNMTQTGFLHAANAGVLLLTDVSEASEPVQITLTRLCQFKRYFPIGSLREKSFKCRLLFTSQQTLEQLEIKSFYLGLLYLLRPQRISLPPLRDRKNDIGLLLIHFTEQACQRLEREYLSAPVELIEKLEPYDFPGNITELKSLVFSAVHISYGNELSVTPFLQALKQSSPSQVKQDIKFPEMLPTINDLVQKLIHEALVRTNNNQSAAAKLLGITQSALSRRLSKSE